MLWPVSRSSANVGSIPSCGSLLKRWRNLPQSPVSLGMAVYSAHRRQSYCRMKISNLLANLLLLTFCCVVMQAQEQSPLRRGEQLFGTTCATCHGIGATGGERGSRSGLQPVTSRPVGSSDSANHQQRHPRRHAPVLPARRSDTSLGAMGTLAQRFRITNPKLEGDVASGVLFFFGEGRCSSCHMVRGDGGTNGPDLSDIGQQLNIRDLELALDNPDAALGSRSAATCPGWAWCPDNAWRW